METLLVDSLPQLLVTRQKLWESRPPSHHSWEPEARERVPPRVLARESVCHGRTWRVTNSRITAGLCPEKVIQEFVGYPPGREKIRRQVMSWFLDPRVLRTKTLPLDLLSLSSPSMALLVNSHMAALSISRL